MIQRIFGMRMGLVVAIACASAWADEKDKPAAAKSPERNAATIGGVPITLQELDDHLLKNNMKLAQELYDARRAALDDMILERAFAAEASAKGVAVDKFIQDRLAEKAKPVTEADVKAYYDANQARMGGRTLEQVGPQIKPYLESQQQSAARAALLAEVKAKSEVRVTLDPPRANVKVGPNDPVKGPADARVTIVEFSEFQCPFCSRVTPTIKQIEQAYGDKVRIAFRHFPLNFHDRAQPAAEAAECAREQGKFWEYHDKLFANQQKLSDEDFKNYATELGLNVDAFKTCYESGRFREDVKKDAADGAAAGVSGTPAFFINGRFLSGAQPFENFKAIIDDELAR